MPYLHYSEVELTQAPNPNHILPIVVAKEGVTCWITVPDLHGNALFEIYHLLLANCLKDEIIQGKSVYANLVELYYNLYVYTEQLKSGQGGAELLLLIRNQIQLYIDYLTLLSCPDQKIFLRLLGDIFSDRGVNDFLTFCNFRIKKKYKIPYEILASNHDMELLAAYFSDALSINKTFESLMQDEFIASLQNMRLWIAYGLIAEEEIKHDIKEFYLPHIKLVSYDRYTEKGLPKLIIYTHAPVDFDVIKDVCESFEVSYRDSTMREFCESVDQLNKIFSMKLISGEINQVLKKQCAIMQALIVVRDRCVLVMENLKKTIEDQLREALRTYVACASKEWIKNGEKEVEDKMKLVFNDNEFNIDALNSLLINFKKQNDLFLNLEMAALKKTLDHYLKIELGYQARNHVYCKQAALAAILWSRVETVVETEKQQKKFTIRLENNTQVVTVSDYCWPKTGWKKNASNVHGHAGAEHVMRYLNSEGSKEQNCFYVNLDQSSLGKSIVKMKGTFFQYYSISRDPSSSICAVPSHSLN